MSLTTTANQWYREAVFSGDNGVSISIRHQLKTDNDVLDSYEFEGVFFYHGPEERPRFALRAAALLNGSREYPAARR